MKQNQLFGLHSNIYDLICFKLDVFIVDFAVYSQQTLTYIQSHLGMRKQQFPIIRHHITERAAKKYFNSMMNMAWVFAFCLGFGLVYLGGGGSDKNCHIEMILYPVSRLVLYQ